MDTLEDIRLKDVAELNESETKVLNENWDKLDTEEQKYYGAVHTKPEEEEFKLPFKSQEELDKYVSEQVTTTIEEQKRQKAEAKKKAKEVTEESFLPEDYKAPNWNEPFTKVVPKIVDKVVEKMEKKTADRRAEMDKINQEFDKQLQEIATKDSNVPEKGTKEREEWEAEIAKVGEKYKLHTMTDAYEVWKVTKAQPQENAPDTPVQIPVEGTPPVKEKSVADKVGTGYGTGTTPKKTTYTSGSRLDEVMEQRMREEGIE